MYWTGWKILVSFGMYLNKQHKLFVLITYLCIDIEMPRLSIKSKNTSVAFLTKTVAETMAKWSYAKK